MSVKSTSVLAGVAAAAMLAAATTVPAAAAELKAEVIHWWTSGGESAAVKVFADEFTKAGGTWIDTAIAGGVNARTAAINRVVGGKPPTMMQFNTGKQFDELVENGLLADLEPFAKEGHWRDFMPKAFVAAATRKNDFYAIPINIHGQNWLWYNKAVLDKAGVEPPKTFDELFIALDKVKAMGGVVPLGFGSNKTWDRGLFNTLLVGKGGNDLYLQIYEKRAVAAVKSPQFKAVAEAYAKLRDYVDQGAPGRNWNDTTAMVITGKAAMQFMGDWAKGEFIAAGLTPGKDYGCTVVGQGYVMGGDVFVFAKTSDLAQIEAQKVLAKIVLDPAVQVKFAQKKGSVPIRLDVDASSLDLCAQTGMKMVADQARQVPAVELLTPASLTGALEDVISEYWNRKDMTADAFVAKFAQTLAEAF